MLEGEQATARLAHNLLEAGIADADQWSNSAADPLTFVKRTLDRWLDRHDRAKIREQFFLDVVLATTLGRYACGTGERSDDISQVFLLIDPDSAGYVVLGPTLRLLTGWIWAMVRTAGSSCWANR